MNTNQPLSTAGGWALLAHGLADHSGKTIAEMDGMNFEQDRYFLDNLNIPLIRCAGDFASSIVVGGKRPVEVRGLKDSIMKMRLKLAVKLAHAE